MLLFCCCCSKRRREADCSVDSIKMFSSVAGLCSARQQDDLIMGYQKSLESDGNMDHGVVSRTVLNVMIDMLDTTQLLALEDSSHLRARWTYHYV